MCTDTLNSKNRKTLEAVFSQPVKSNIKWNDVETLLLAVGADLIEGSGSRVRFIKDDVALSLHRPHPRSEIKPYQVKDIRSFLEILGVEP